MTVFPSRWSNTTRERLIGSLARNPDNCRDGIVTAFQGAVSESLLNVQIEPGNTLALTPGVEFVCRYDKERGLP